MVLSWQGQCSSDEGSQQTQSMHNTVKLRAAGLDKASREERSDQALSHMVVSLPFSAEIKMLMSPNGFNKHPCLTRVLQISIDYTNPKECVQDWS